ncbi:hypothetical protein BCY86_06415 [Pajaroellobacter abortibovis]|uniref:Uncharacterized protein n=1 Tax=Pajaroellobacter abortibovis TaxID=1882918 RepID=A0A1L6MXN4_9BACT|nr:hypothetical protein [Pajaroellobacter abortibovis]APS00351.1 hypothetical protein BCY86_06415 [Pajaroellobacter abortibovis]
MCSLPPPSVDDVDGDPESCLGSCPALMSAPEGVHFPVITSWQEGLGDCVAIQNQMAVFNAMTGSGATRQNRLKEED